MLGSLPQVSALIQKLTDEQLMQEMQKPSGMAPMYVLQAEYQRRSRLHGAGVTSQQQAIDLPTSPKGYAAGGTVGQFGYTDPEANQQMADARSQAMMQRLGVPGQVGGLGDYYKTVQQYLPDTTSSAYGDITGQMQKDYDSQVEQDKGRPLMEMGLAMMRAKTPNFFEALGEGGEAGLSAKDKIRQTQRGIMQSLMNAKLQQAQAGDQRNNMLFNAANAQQMSARSGIEQAMGIGQGQASQYANLTNDAAKARQQYAEEQAKLATELRIAQIRHEGVGGAAGGRGLITTEGLPTARGYTSWLKSSKQIFEEKFVGDKTRGNGLIGKPIMHPELGTPIVDIHTGKPFVWDRETASMAAQVEAARNMGIDPHVFNIQGYNGANKAQVFQPGQKRPWSSTAPGASAAQISKRNRPPLSAFEKK